MTQPGGFDLANPIFAAIDTPELDHALALAKQLEGQVGGLKVGKEFFTALGPDGARRIGALAPLFLDLKFHDIPNTVAGAVRSVCRLAPFAINVHAGGGRAMMEAAAKAAAEGAAAAGCQRPLMLGVTVLTSLDDEDLAAVGQDGPVGEQVLRLAELSASAGLDGVVCSPREIAALRRALGPDFVLMVPGIRPTWAVAEDQKRIMTPAEAIAAGATFLVIGRPISGAAEPAAAARRIAADLAAG